MTYPLLNTSTQGMDSILVYINQVSGNIFIPAFIMTFFVVIMMAIYHNQIRRLGQGNLINSFAVSSFLTLILTILFKLKEGLVDNITFSTIIGLFILGMILFLYSE
jgi:hypothetical protein